MCHTGGWLSGRVVAESGQALDLDDVFGIAEDIDTWWRAGAGIRPA